MAGRIPSQALVEKLRQRGKWNKADAGRIMAEYERSGMSVQTFARTHELPAHKLYWWRNHLEELSEAEPAMSFAPVVVTGLGRSPALTVRLGALELDVHAPSEVEPSWLAQLCAAVTTEGE